MHAKRISAAHNTRPISFSQNDDLTDEDALNYAPVDINLDDAWGDDLSPSTSKQTPIQPQFPVPPAPPRVPSPARVAVGEQSSPSYGASGSVQHSPTFVVARQRQVASTQDIINHVVRRDTPTAAPVVEMQPPIVFLQRGAAQSLTTEIQDTEMTPPPAKRTKPRESPVVDVPDSLRPTESVSNPLDTTIDTSFDFTSLPLGNRIPGPAGALPSFRNGMPLPDISPTKKAARQDDRGFLRSPTKQKKLEDTVDFRGGPWMSMLQSRNLVPFGSRDDVKLKYNIKFILENGFKWKTPELVVLVKCVRFDFDDAKVTLRDPSGDMEGTVSRQTIEEYPELQQGAVLVLKDVACFSPRPSVHHLIITEANVKELVPAHAPIPTLPAGLAHSRASFLDIYSGNAASALFRQNPLAALARTPDRNTENKEIKTNPFQGMMRASPPLVTSNIVAVGSAGSSTNESTESPWHRPRHQQSAKTPLRAPEQPRPGPGPRGHPTAQSPYKPPAPTPQARPLPLQPTQQTLHFQPPAAAQPKQLPHVVPHTSDLATQRPLVQPRPDIGPDTPRATGSTVPSPHPNRPVPVAAPPPPQAHSLPKVPTTPNPHSRIPQPPATPNQQTRPGPVPPFGGVVKQQITQAPVVQSVRVISAPITSTPPGGGPQSQTHSIAGFNRRPQFGTSPTQRPNNK